MEIKQESQTIEMSQRRYILDLIQRFGMETCNPVSTSTDKDLHLVKDESKGDNKKRPYRELVRALRYLAVVTRPNISYTVNVLSQFNDCYGEYHWGAAKRVLRYLKVLLILV